MGGRRSIPNTAIPGLFDPQGPTSTPWWNAERQALKRMRLPLNVSGLSNRDVEDTVDAGRGPQPQSTSPTRASAAPGSSALRFNGLVLLAIAP